MINSQHNKLLLLLLLNNPLLLLLNNPHTPLLLLSNVSAFHLVSPAKKEGNAVIKEPSSIVPSVETERNHKGRFERILYYFMLPFRDGYFIVHPVMNRQLDTTPAFPQQTPMKPYSLVLFTTADVSKV